ncbi:MAG: hypothetical protein WCX79_04690, partial [Candidatus Paceibacterota bacterium]
MYKNKIVQIVYSLALFPVFTGAVPLTAGLYAVNDSENLQIELIQKNNIETLDSFSFNQGEEESVNKEKEAIITLRAKAIDSYFQQHDMPLQGTGRKMVEEAEKYGLDWRLLPAIAVRESSGGRFACKKATFNSFGWGSCKISFKSNEDAIETIAKNLAGQNPNTAKYYAGKDTEGILLAYNPPYIVPKYVPQVMNIMERMGE